MKFSPPQIVSMIDHLSIIDNNTFFVNRLNKIFKISYIEIEAERINDNIIKLCKESKLFYIYSISLISYISVVFM